VTPSAATATSCWRSCSRCWRWGCWPLNPCPTTPTLPHADAMHDEALWRWRYEQYPDEALAEVAERDDDHGRMAREVLAERLAKTKGG